MIKETKQITGKAAFVLAVQDAKNAIFNAKNPHFNSKFANEKSCKEATDPSLFKFGLAMSHQLNIEPSFRLVSIVIDSVGDTVAESQYPLTIAKPQDMGSQITYAKRYNRCAIMGIIADEDDDGNGAETTVDNKISDTQVDELKQLIKSTRSNEQAYLNLIKVKALADLTAQNFDNAKAKLVNKQKQMAQPETNQGQA